MTKDEYIAKTAAAALQGMLAFGSTQGRDPSYLAAKAYDIAERMWDEHVRRGYDDRR